MGQIELSKRKNIYKNSRKDIVAYYIKKLRRGVVLALALSLVCVSGLYESEYSFLFPEVSISSAIRFDEKDNTNSKIVEGKIDDFEVRFFILDFFKGLF